MNIWLVTVGEPLPIDTENPRLLRAGMLAKLLAEHGHEVTWWSSTFNHSAKRHIASENQFLKIQERLNLHLLHGPAYHRNVSLRRILNHQIIGRRFLALAETFPLPDIILCSFPTIELSEAVVKFGRKHHVPTVLDVRDLWPDVFTEVLPPAVKSLAKVALYPLFRSTRKAFTDCSAIVGSCDSYLDWGLKYAGREKKDTDGVFPIGYQRRPVSEAARLQMKAKLLGLGVAVNTPIFWFCGSFGTSYDLRTVIEAGKILDRLEIRDVNIVISGGGDRAEEYRALARGARNVYFTGWLDADEITAMMEFASVGLAAYATHAPQSLPNKIFEYLSAGVPILSCLGGDAPALLEDHACGLTYEAGNPQSLAARMLELLQNSAQREAMGRAARALYHSRFEMNRIHESFEKYLVNVATREAHV